MATYRPELHSVDAVMSYYDNYDEPGFEIYAGMKRDTNFCRYLYYGTDKDLGRQKLADALHTITCNPDNTNPYLLQITTQKGKVKNEGVNSITFQLNRQQQYMPVQYQNNNTELLAKLNAIEQRIALMEADDDDDDDEPEDVGGIGALFNSPEVKQLIMQGLMSAFTKNNKTVAIAGVDNDDETKIAAALEVLRKNVPNLPDKLLKLAQMSIDEPVKFKMMLNLL